jgi:hypothetical protein
MVRMPYVQPEARGFRLSPTPTWHQGNRAYYFSQLDLAVKQPWAIGLGNEPSEKGRLT